LHDQADDDAECAELAVEEASRAFLKLSLE